ncbi:tRNA-dihydrouridine(47) synthase [NAD(P)(+)]-like protein [Dermatophagoides pteronyssinus]|uniref:tRNA-dihydrouridine(47) synthase [NAD(P)(+)] n=1 Tax=Dermatophagoides pteronyssinus TaxID=6956 RepID=A0ABQ8J7J3_DERPT|nr:tRNA-dihydrouridine(47) synthase [NAD(P)(+)]-like protein [Dermatophagoides pteronyssinus]
MEKLNDNQDGDIIIEKGVAPIRKEFLIERCPTNNVVDKKNDEFISGVENDDNSENKRKISNDNGSENHGDNDDDENTNEKRKKKMRGQNKQRRGQMHKAVKQLGETRNHRICRAYFRENKCPFGDKCTFSHDIDAYLKENPDRNDIGDHCPNFERYGKCNAGIFCRYGSGHLRDGHFNVIDEEKYERISREDRTMNYLSKDVQFQLRKRKYDFSEANRFSQQICSVDNIRLAELKKEPRPKPLKRTIDFRGKLYLAPLTTVGNLPFRRICKEFGADITCGEMAVCSSLLEGSSSEWALIRRHSTEDIFGVQLCGSGPDQLARCAQIISNECDVDFIDLNMGCPIDLVYRKGAGCALMERRRKLDNIIYSVTSVTNIPFTLKMRTGVHNGKNIAKNLINSLREWPRNRLAMIAIHGRSREQRYTKSADWSYIGECAVDAHQSSINNNDDNNDYKPLPIFGSGDIISYEDYYEKLEKYNVDGIMIGRGALIKPWIFTEIKEKRVWDIRSSERMDILRRYVNYGLSNWGSDREGVEKTRWFLLEWLSFLHRYIPVGLLERLPQQINDRPPRYRGRDDLETLMSSSLCRDWISISEMLLGPVDDGFQFIPKHKASSY